LTLNFGVIFPAVNYYKCGKPNSNSFKTGSQKLFACRLAILKYTVYLLKQLVIFADTQTCLLY